MQRQGNIEEKLSSKLSQTQARFRNPENNIQQEAEILRGIRDYVDQLTRMNRETKSMITSLSALIDKIEELRILDQIQRSKNNPKVPLQAPGLYSPDWFQRHVITECNRTFSHHQVQ